MTADTASVGLIGAATGSWLASDPPPHTGPSSDWDGRRGGGERGRGLLCTILFYGLSGTVTLKPSTSFYLFANSIYGLGFVAIMAGVADIICVIGAVRVAAVRRTQERLLSGGDVEAADVYPSAAGRNSATSVN